MEFWDAINDIPLPVQWNGHVYHVAFHILTRDEEEHVIRTARDLMSEADHEEKNIRERIEATLTLCFAVVSVNDIAAPNPHKSTEDFKKKYALFANLTGSLVDVLTMAYQSARLLPLAELATMDADPNIEAGRS